MICPSHTTHRAVHAVGGSERSQSMKPPAPLTPPTVQFMQWAVPKDRSQ